MSVVLRCPTCGTTQRHAGDCEACSDGEVRYFCTNHDVGVWLDGPVCGSCGMKFRDPPAKPPTPRIPRVATAPSGVPDLRPPPGRRVTELPSEPPVARRPRPAEREEPAELEVLPPAPSSLGELLEALAEERARGRAPSEVEDAPWVPRAAEPPRSGFPLAGCLVRSVGLVLLLIAAAIIFLFLLFAGFIVD